MRPRLSTMLVGLAGAIGKSSFVATRRKLIRATARDQLALVFAFCQIGCNCGAFAPYFLFFLLVGSFGGGVTPFSLTHSFYGTCTWEYIGGRCLDWLV